MMKNDVKIDLGSVQVHKKVLAEIVAAALHEVSGVKLIEKNISNVLVELFGKKDFPGIDVKVDDHHEVTLEIKVLVQYGINIPDVARLVQETVKSAVDKTLDVHLKDIHVNVQGIVRGEK
jgi:uncharacterized alkaline shock family protein YloU